MRRRELGDGEAKESGTSEDGHQRAETALDGFVRADSRAQRMFLNRLADAKRSDVVELSQQEHEDDMADPVLQMDEISQMRETPAEV